MLHRLSLLALVLIFVTLPVAAGVTGSEPMPEASRSAIEALGAEVPQSVNNFESTSEQPAVTPGVETERGFNDMAFEDWTAAFSGCVDPTCAIDFLCYETCAAGPEDEFCRCVQRCILFCA